MFNEMGSGCGGAEGPCVCDPGPCALYPEPHAPQRPWRSPPAEEPLLCEHCGKNRTGTRFSEGYGTEEECALSDRHGDSDADADIEDTDSRLQEAGSLQRISSRRRKRPRIARQDTTESEDDGVHSHRAHRWNLRLSPSHGRPILEESVSQVRPLVICPPSAHSAGASGPSWRSGPRALVLLTLLPLSLAALMLLSYLQAWTAAR